MRLLTRSDFDGLVSAVLLKEMGVPEHFPDMLRFVDKCDSANLTIEEIESPTG